jgi:hypothetical protein
MPTPIPASSYPLLMDLINETYFDEVERIDGAQVDDNGDIICAATDGRKALAVRVTDDGIDIRLRQAKASATQFAAPQKKKQCKTGVSCGASCISASKTCSKKTTPKQKAQKQKIVADAKLYAPANRPDDASARPSGDSVGSGSVDFWLTKLDSLPEVGDTAPLWEKFGKGGDDDAIMTEIDRIFAEKQAKERDGVAFMAGLREALMNESGITADEASQLAGKIKFYSGESGFGKLRRVPKDEQKEIKDHIAEFFRLSGGVGSKELDTFVDDRSGRAFAVGVYHTIGIGDGTKQSIFHEAAHFAENETRFKDLDGALARIKAGDFGKGKQPLSPEGYKSIGEVNNEWVKSRATKKTPKKLSEITGLPYGDEEKAYIDHFISPYVGKITPSDSSSEVFSMGVDHFTTPERMIKLWNGDREHFDLTITNLRRLHADRKSR